MPPNTPVRLRLINSSKEPRRVLLAARHTGAALWTATRSTGRASSGRAPSPQLAAGGRYDVSFTMPAGAVTLRPEGAGNSAAMTLSAGGRAAPADLSQGRSFDRLSYGEPEGPARDAVPTLMVGEGDRVHMRIINRNINDHPMHLHGHRVRVLSRNGEAVTGSTWWTDTLNIAPGETSPCHGTSH